MTDGSIENPYGTSLTKRLVVPSAENELFLQHPTYENGYVTLVDYMGGDNSFGALSYGFAWKFAPNTSVIFGYVDQIEDDLAADTFTVQVDIDFDVFNK